ncbi:RDD family protein [Chryseobacterium sp. CH21]|uniref:RDD family protein n=1 Tax=Chryseobacterium sp. CH21 TaxID=713556 RepID=UPI00100A4838|nr:RDD family protein [Chryseobacterium sp. CH21]RXM40381.1 RDD family protein [Chryseobacterium sp. CH21]
MRKYLVVVDRHKAPTGTRFLNYFLDRIFIQIIFYIFFFAFALFYSIVFGEIISEEDIDNNTSVAVSIIISYFFVFFAYFFFMEYYLGKTIAKYITGTKVISIDGNQPTSLQIVGRIFSRMVPFDSLSFFGESGWHDKWSETRVINIKNYQAEIQAKSEIEALGKKEIA